MYKLEDFRLIDDGTEQKDVICNGSRMMTGSGLIGCRGTLEEAEAAAMPATIMNGLYDRNGDGWREPVNIPNTLSIRLIPEGDKVLGITNDSRLVSHSQELDFRYGIFSRRTAWSVPGIDESPMEVTVRSRRFISMFHRNRIFLEYRISCSGELKLRVEHGIQTTVYDIHGPHLNDYVCRFRESGMNAECRTIESGVNLRLEHDCIRSGFPGDSSDLELQNELGYYHSLEFTSSSDSEYVLHCSGTVSVEGLTPEMAHAAWSGSESFNAELNRHKELWDRIWDRGDVRIEGDDTAAAALRYSLYQLQIIAPRAAGLNLSILARGLSGQTYKGAVFWDTEMFISPYFLATDPDTARRFIMYRIETLDGARRKAEEYGYRGAFYAWESQESGDDACSDYNVTDVFSGRPLRTYFRDKQIHISAAVVYALDRYLEMIGDDRILMDGALEMAVECARFFLSRCVWSPMHRRYEIHDVLGPDEYHERVDNNAYTSRMAVYTFETVLALTGYSSVERFRGITMNPEYETFRDSLIERLECAEELREIGKIASEMYIPGPGEKKVLYRSGRDSVEADESSGLIIEQFSGYYSLEDRFPPEVRETLLDPREYWGGSSGPASGTRVIKQADVVLLLSLFPEEVSPEVLKANYDFYEPRTEHGSSLSACAHALLACRIGEPDAALLYFYKTAMVDIAGDSKQFAGLVYIGGTHPAANGGAWLTAVYGFCGFSVQDGKIKLNPRLPSGWKKISFSVQLRDKVYDISVSNQETSIIERKLSYSMK